MSESYGPLQEPLGLPERRLPVMAAPAITEPDAYPYYHSVLSGIITSIDTAAILASSLMAASIEPAIIHQDWHKALPLADLMSGLGFMMIPKNRVLLYVPTVRQPATQLHYLAPPLLIGALLHIVVLSMLRHPLVLCLELSMVWLLLSSAVLCMVRIFEIALLGSPAIARQLARDIAVVGSDETAIRFAGRIANEAGSTYRLAGVFDDHETAENPQITDGTLLDLIAHSRENPLHAIVLAIPPAADPVEQVAKISWQLRSVLSDVYVVPNTVHGIDVLLPIERLGPFPLLVLQRRPLSDWQVVKKTILDVTLGAMALLALSPLMIGAAIAIKATSPGPVFFRQPRLGFNNRMFMIFKFRTMYTDMSDKMAAQQTARDDPRVTPVGRWLRRLSIDELPQLLNVMRVEMSLVGPRPHAPHTRAGGMLLDDALAEYVIRHQVRPGITGWAQVNGARGQLVTLDDLRRRVALDLEYMQRWSLRFDLKILVLTVIREVLSRHAF
ncbi:MULTISPECIES: exopolysaccharide biosynthesis polyprenyl glycosylphosphotransferase [Gluconacetobacter]|uniref:Exopolysaccharide biosynthesis polyprenyl glycosylphosphotransferase n=2 Tax=Gluconacetobacter TaxID=89583 RepID=A0A7W4JH44_9PROT|nr:MULTISPECIES: exopolysaccharide biosynthesis polyprenyl glycosylphosphotransferase [Gluconacetobacter]MBB2172376.1 exopolysaccharide biosynthesis polyprenyl glycosylphosphotransferase [Gluconacetobacter asukensis]MBB2181148.1 exopolysaccharide biosynthesis polyprenyl glycosylphosphotransferase [Gluconacetobacter tumulicola]